tara:strand:- start:253 stop:1137 length:885 start_codon:yes stop_codon:yes gene_type:complete
MSLKITIKTIKDALDVHKDMLEHEGRFNSRHKSLLKNIEGYFGKYKVHEIPKYVVDNYYKSEQKRRNVKPQTITREISVINASLSLCYNLEYLETKPRMLDASHKSDVRNVWLTEPEIKKLLNAKRLKRNPSIEKACKIALTTTARKSAIRELRVEQIRWDEGLIDFNNDLMRNKSKPRAVVPIPKSIESMLRTACKESKKGFVLQSNSGNKIGDPLYILKECVRDIGLNKDICFHTLRHTGAVHMAMNNVPLMELSRYMGHKSIEITEKVYAKFYPSFMKHSSEVAGGLINDC